VKKYLAVSLILFLSFVNMYSGSITTDVRIDLTNDILIYPKISYIDPDGIFELKGLKTIDYKDAIKEFLGDHYSSKKGKSIYYLNINMLKFGYLISEEEDGNYKASFLIHAIVVLKNDKYKTINSWAILVNDVKKYDVFGDSEKSLTVNNAFSLFFKQINDVLKIDKNNNKSKKIIQKPKKINIEEYNALKNKTESFCSTIASIGFTSLIGFQYYAEKNQPKPYFELLSFFIEVYPIDIFSIEYRFDTFGLLSSLVFVSLINPYNYVSLRNTLNFHIHDIKKSRFPISGYFTTGFIYENYFGENISLQFFTNDPYTEFYGKFSYNIYTLVLGGGLLINFNSPYINRYLSAFGNEINYKIAFYPSSNQIVQSFEISIFYKWGRYFYTDKKRKSFIKDADYILGVQPNL